MLQEGRKNRIACSSSNYDSTKVCFAYLGFYSGAAPDKEKPWFSRYQDRVK
jgi:hypothetical protein